MNTPALTLEQARRDVRSKKRALARRERLLMKARGCSMFVHARFTRGCERCEAHRAASRAVVVASAELDAALRRLEAVESQQPVTQWIGGAK